MFRVLICRKVIAPERLKGFMSASWMTTTCEDQVKLLSSIGELSSALEAYGL